MRLSARSEIALHAVLPRRLCLLVCPTANVYLDMRFPLVLCLALFSLSLTPLTAQEPSGQSTKEKISTIRDLGKRGSEAIVSLSNYLGDPDVDVRQEAVKAIVNIGTQYSLDPLVRATHDNDSEVQTEAVDGLVNFYLPGYVTTGGLSHTFTRVGKRIKNTFSSRNDQIIEPGITVRPEIIQAIGSLVTGGASLDARAAAARALGVLHGAEALPELEKALQSRDTSLIFESLVAIQKIKDPSAGKSVVLLANDPDKDVQVAALETLGMLHTTEAAPQIRQAVGRAKNQRVRRAALGSLAMLADPADHSIFQEYSNNKDAELRAAALEGLGRLRDPQDVPSLEQAFNEEKDTKARLAAAFALAYEGKVETSEFSALRYVVNGLDISKTSSISEAYLAELSKRNDVRKALIPILQQGTRAEKIGLVHALAETGDTDTKSAIQALTSDPDSEVSVAAARSLKTIKARLP